MRRIFLSLLPVPFVTLFFVGACSVSANVGELGTGVPDASSDAPPNDGSSSNDTDAPTGPTSDGGADVDPAPIDAGCGVSFAQRGAFIDVGVVTGPTPSLSGGPIVSGLYELTAMRVFFAGETGTMQVRETMRVRGSTTAGAFDVLTEARNATGSFEAYPLHGETRTFMTGAGPAIFVKPECPTDDFEQGSRFGMTADTLTLFDDSTGTERVYRRIE